MKKEHGVKREAMYATMPDPEEKVYPHVDLPAEVFEGHQCEIGEKYRVEIEIEIKHMDEHSYGGELLTSEIESDEQEKKENEK